MRDVVPQNFPALERRAKNEPSPFRKGELNMAKKVLGRGSYRAVRMAGMVRLTATGETPHFNDKTDFEQLPFMIFPPMYGFFFIEQDVSLPAMRPFTYEESIAFPGAK